MCRGGSGDPNATREAALKRSVLKTARQKMRRRDGNDAVIAALVSAKEEPNWSKTAATTPTHSMASSPIEVNTCDPEVAGTTSVEVVTNVLGTLTDEQHRALATQMISAEELEEVRAAQSDVRSRWNVTWERGAKIAKVILGPECDEPGCVEPAWHLPLVHTYGKTRACISVLRYGGRNAAPGVVVAIDNGSHLASFKFKVKFGSIVAIDVDVDTSRIYIEFCQPLLLSKKIAGTKKWITCNGTDRSSTTNCCRLDMCFMQPPLLDLFLEGLHAMGKSRMEFLLNQDVDYTSSMNSSSMELKRQQCANANRDVVREFINANFAGSPLHLQLQHRRRLYYLTKAHDRIEHGPWKAVEGSTRAFPTECAACRQTCSHPHCGKTHFLVCYPAESGCKFVDQFGKDHTQCPTLL